MILKCFDINKGYLNYQQKSWSLSASDPLFTSCSHTHSFCVFVCLPAGGLRSPAEKKLLPVYGVRSAGGELLAKLITSAAAP